MKKPELSDFGLTQEKLNIYEKQESNYYNRLDEHCKNVKSVKKTIIWISLILTLVVLIINIAIGFEDVEGAGITLGICAFWDITVVFYCFQSLDATIWNIGENKKSEIRRQTINISLEKAIEEYNKALREYEHYLKKCSIDFWNSLNGLEFEKEIAKLFKVQGYDVTITPATADGGVDIVLIKNDERIAVQCKHHAKPVGPNDVRALQGVVASQNYSKGIFVSLNGFTSTVHQEVKGGKVHIELLELDDILEMAKGDSNPSTTKLGGAPQTLPLISEKELIIKLYERISDEDLLKLFGKSVRHKQFGEGIISNIIDRKYIEIYFLDKSECKKFVFPDAFADRYIVPVDFKLIRKD